MTRVLKSATAYITPKTRVLTELGAELIREHASIGGSLKEIAGALGVPETTIGDWSRNPDSKPAFHAAWHSGRWEFSRGLRESQLELSKVNSQMAIHMGKYFLEQDDKPQEVHHLHRVVGTLPDYDSTSADWQRKFAPDPVVDGGKLIEEEIEEAEVVRTGDSDEAQ